MTAPPDLAPPVEAVPAPRRRGFVAFIAAAAVVLLAVGGAGVVALLDALDPGERMASAQAMPPDIEAYVDIDFRSLQDLDRLLMAFDAAFADAEIEPGLDGVLDFIDDELRAEFGIGVDDIEPWVGRDVGIGVSQLDALADLDSADPEVIAAISVRDESGADEFLDRLVAIGEANYGATFTESTYQGVRIFTDEMFGSAGRSGDLLLVGSTDAAVHRAIDAQRGESLADDEAMQDTLDGLPSDRAVTVYLSASLFEDLGDALAELPIASGPVLPFGEMDAVALSAALTEDGIRVDVVQRRDPAETGLAAAATASGSSELPSLLPQGTFAYFGVAGDEPLLGEAVTIDAMLQEAGLSGAELAEARAAIDEMEAALGFDIEEGLLRHLGGDLGFGMFPAAEPLGGDPLAPQIGFMGMVGVTDPVAVARTATDFRTFLADQGVPMADRRAADATLYAVGDGGSDVVMFGVAGDYLVLATDEGDVAGMFDGGATLADAPLYQRASDALPQRGDPVLFVDVQAALAAFDVPPEEADVVAPLIGVVANADETDTTYRFTLLLLIDY